MTALKRRHGVLFLAAGLVLCSLPSMAQEWKEFARATTGIYYYDAASVQRVSPNILRVWIHNVTKHESNYVEFNCDKRLYHVVDVVQYDDAGLQKKREAYDDIADWSDIAHGSVAEALHKLVCR